MTVISLLPEKFEDLVSGFALRMLQRDATLLKVAIDLVEAYDKENVQAFAALKAKVNSFKVITEDLIELRREIEEKNGAEFLAALEELISKFQRS